MKKEVKAPVVKHILIVIISMLIFSLVFYIKTHEHQIDPTRSGFGLLKIFKRGLIMSVIYFLFSYVFGSKIVTREEAEKISWVNTKEQSPESNFVLGSLLLGILLAIPFLLVF